MGNLAVARPALLLGADSRRVFKSVMMPGSCAQFQMRALNTLTDLLKVTFMNAAIACCRLTQ